MGKTYKSLSSLEAIVQNQREKLWKLFLTLNHPQKVLFLEERDIDFKKVYSGKYSAKRKGVRLHDVKNPFTGKDIFVRVNKTIRIESLKDEEYLCFSIALKPDIDEDNPENIFVATDCYLAYICTGKRKKDKKLKQVPQISHPIINSECGLPVQKRSDYEKEREAYLQITGQKTLEAREEKRKSEEAQKERFRLFIQKHDVKNLIHFTKLDNLQSILDNGVLPVSDLRGSSVKYVPNDLQRFDYMTDCTCLSVEFPNDYNFRTFRMRYPESKWAILLINPEILCDRTCYFAEHNAATYSISHHIQQQKSTEAFDNMFSYVINFKKSDGTFDIIFRQQGLKKYLPTSSQAEILVEGRIDRRYIKGVLFSDMADLKVFASELKNKEFSMYVDKEIFSCSRRNYHNFETLRRI